MRKRRAREHIIADLSVHHVEGFVLRCGWTVERTRHDYGIDLMRRTYSETGEAETVAVYMQLKATDRLSLSADKQNIRFRLEWRDLLFWLNEPLPVIRVVYNALEDRACWLDVQEYFRAQSWEERAGKAETVTVHIPAGNRIDAAAIRLFGRLRAERAAPK